MDWHISVSNKFTAAGLAKYFREHNLVVRVQAIGPRRQDNGVFRNRGGQNLLVANPGMEDKLFSDVCDNIYNNYFNGSCSHR